MVQRGDSDIFSGAAQARKGLRPEQLSARIFSSMAVKIWLVHIPVAAKKNSRSKNRKCMVRVGGERLTGVKSGEDDRSCLAVTRRHGQPSRVEERRRLLWGSAPPLIDAALFVLVVLDSVSVRHVPSCSDFPTARMDST